MSKLVAVSAESMSGFESMLDPRFGRAFAYVVVDPDTNTVIAELENKARQAAHGAGTGAAALMASNDINAIISGRFGPKAFQALSELGIELWTAPEGISVKEAISQFNSGNLNRETSPSGGGMGGGRGIGRGGGGMGGRRGMGRGGGGGMGGGRGMGRGGGGMGGGRGMGRGGGGGKGK